MTTKDFIPGMYRAIDAMDSRAVADLMTEEGSLRFANLEPVNGRENIFTFLENFFKSIHGINHSELEYWKAENNWFVTGNVTYTRHDSTHLEVPFAVRLVMKGDLIDRYLIYVDNSTLYN